jgi:hypothetical protein
MTDKGEPLIEGSSKIFYYSGPWKLILVDGSLIEAQYRGKGLGGIDYYLPLFVIGIEKVTG